MTDPFFGITDYFTYIVGVIAVILLPGPNSMYCLYVGINQGVKKGYQAICAILIADSILMLAAVLGAATLIKTSPTLFVAFKAIGGLYLAYIGLQLLKACYAALQSSADSEQPEQDEQKSFTASATDSNVFLKALILGLSNPKAILFFLSFFLQFVDPNYEYPALSFSILGGILQVISFVYLTVLIFMGTNLIKFFEKNPYLGAAGNAFVGVLFVGFAVSLWIAQLPQ